MESPWVEEGLMDMVLLGLLAKLVVVVVVVVIMMSKITTVYVDGGSRTRSVKVVVG
jgi:hypothetical protein